MAEVEVKTDNEGAVMTLKGSLNIESAAQIHTAFIEATQAHEVLRVDMSQTESVDLSFFQLVCALYKEAVREGKKLVFESVPERIRIKAEKMGFTEEYTGGYFWKGDFDGKKDNDS